MLTVRVVSAPPLTPLEVFNFVLSEEIKGARMKTFILAEWEIHDCGIMVMLLHDGGLFSLVLLYVVNKKEQNLC